MNYELKKIFSFFVLLALVSCSGGDNGDGGASVPEADMRTVTIYLAMPPGFDDATRVGDPGSANLEDSIDWDEIAVMIEAIDNTPFEGGSKYHVQTISKADYDKLSEYNGFRYITLDLAVGSEVYIYAVTYSSGVTGSPENDIENFDGGTFADLTISNEYAYNNGTLDVPKFLSVASGYYKDGEGSRTYTVPDKIPENREQMPSITLTRLAAKIDIQWDAQDAYDQGYTNVAVNDFSYRNYTDDNVGSTTESGKGTGFLFPDLTHSDGVTTVDGSSTFYNTSAISKRNGRVYHYVFPNGKEHSITFNISATKTENNSDNSVENDYTFNFGSAVQRATWYKINTTIRGLEKSNTTIEITPDDSGSASTTN